MSAPLPPLLMLAEGRKPRLRSAPKPLAGRNAEAKVQRAILEYIWTVAPDCIVFHVPNGGARDKAEAARLKWQGVVPGVPDLVVLRPGGHVALIEVKADAGRLSDAQEAFRAHLIRMGVPYVVARSIDDVRLAFTQWKIPTRKAGR